MDIKYIGADEVSEKLKMNICIDLMEDVFLDYANGKIKNVLRSMASMGEGILGCMPGVIKEKHAAGAKLITVIHDNAKRGLPSHQGIVAIFDTETGMLKGICDGTRITAIRTGAVSGLRTKYMSNPGAKTLAVIGSGVQARMNTDAVLCVRGIENVNIWSRNRAHAEGFAAEMREKHPTVKFTVFDSGREAVQNADVICTVTPGKDVVLKGEWLKKGVHINAVGACTKADRELDADCVKAARLFTDSAARCRAEGGDFVQALNEGAVDENHLLGTLGEIVAGMKKARETQSDITIFNSLGLAEEDIACADYLLK